MNQDWNDQQKNKVKKFRVFKLHSVLVYLRSSVRYIRKNTNYYPLFQKFRKRFNSTLFRCGSTLKYKIELIFSCRCVFCSGCEAGFGLLNH